MTRMPNIPRTIPLLLASSILLAACASTRMDEAPVSTVTPATGPAAPGTPAASPATAVAPVA
ncbi:MAG TPA: hypothetical protein VFM98_11270, partial [Ramlibacter sp.]|nr:hypothetical protein [Ramlibacter sp.]